MSRALRRRVGRRTREKAWSAWLRPLLRTTSPRWSPVRLTAPSEPRAPLTQAELDALLARFWERGS